MMFNRIWTGSRKIKAYVGLPLSLLILLVTAPLLTAGGTAAPDLDIQPTVMSGRSGKVVVDYAIRGDGAAFLGSVSIHAILAGQSQQCSAYPSQSPGRSIHYRCEFERTALKPGRHVLAMHLRTVPESGSDKGYQIDHIMPLSCQADQGCGYRAAASSPKPLLPPVTEELTHPRNFAGGGSGKTFIQTIFPQPLVGFLR